MHARMLHLLLNYAAALYTYYTSNTCAGRHLSVALLTQSTPCAAVHRVMCVVWCWRGSYDPTNCTYCDQARNASANASYFWDNTFSINETAETLTFFDGIRAARSTQV